MFYIKQLECLYCDVKNPNRSVGRDQVREVDLFTAKTREEAKEIVFDILSQNGGLQRLTPKILSSDTKSMWIECDQPSRSFKSQGCTDYKVLAIQIQYRELDEDVPPVGHEMKEFAETLGPKFSL